jgi:hypothetical protein
MGDTTAFNWKALILQKMVEGCVAIDKPWTTAEPPDWFLWISQVAGTVNRTVLYVKHDRSGRCVAYSVRNNQLCRYEVLFQQWWTSEIHRDTHQFSLAPVLRMQARWRLRMLRRQRNLRHSIVEHWVREMGLPDIIQHRVASFVR